MFGSERVIGSFVKVIEPPILPIQIKVDVIPLGDRLGWVIALYVACLLVSHHLRRGLACCPALIMTGSDRDRVVFVNGRRGEDREFEFRFTVFLFEFQA